MSPLGAVLLSCLVATHLSRNPTPCCARAILPDAVVFLGIYCSCIGESARVHALMCTSTASTSSAHSLVLHRLILILS